MEGDFFELANRLVNLRGFMIFLIPAAALAANLVFPFNQVSELLGSAAATKNVFAWKA